MLFEDDLALARACAAANRDSKTGSLEREWDRVQDEIEEPADLTAKVRR